MKTNIVIDISPPIPYPAKFWFLSYGPKCWWSIKLQDSWKCNISRKKWMMNFIFGMQIDIEVFYRLTLSFWVCVTRHAQSHPNKFAYLCNISRKAWGMKLMFCLQINTKRFYKLIEPPWMCKSGMSKVSKTSLQCLCKISMNTWRIKQIFCLQINLKRFLQGDTIILDVCGQTCPNYPKW